jgi:hypothetical protein
MTGLIMNARARRLLLAPLFALLAPAADAVAQASTTDPRVGLRAGWIDAESAILNLEHVANRPKPQEFFNPDNPGDRGQTNSDLAFRGDYVFQGTYGGYQIWDVSNPRDPQLVRAYVCPGGQGDVSVHGNLLFMSVEAVSGRVDCGTEGVPEPVSAERFRGVRIFDISDMRRPRQVAAVQACRGSHTHTLIDPRDGENLYVYISGTAGVRPGEELPGCVRAGPDEDPNTALFRIEVVHVPLARPQDARIVNSPRIFADAQGNIAGLWPGGTHGEGTQRSAVTNHCHDITAYSDIGLAAGACSGNGILLDITDPVNPRRIDEVIDPNFAYWHSATFSNDGRSVIFTDEWGGGGQPRCRATDRPEWGANAIFTIDDDGRMSLASYYKLPAAQTDQENCVAHNGSLIPVPGRDIKVQAWYQGGVSVFDFTDPSSPFEIAYFDRGPMDAERLVSGGYWSAYWYNGHIYGSEMARGLDVFALRPSEHLTQNEIDAALLVQWDEFNPQDQRLIEWPAAFVVARAYLDQLVRADEERRAWATPVYSELERAERLSGAARAQALIALAARIDTDAAQGGDTRRMQALSAVVRGLAATD